MELDVIELEIMIDALLMLKIQENINHVLKMNAKERNEYLLTGERHYSKDDEIRENLIVDIIAKILDEIEVKKNGKEVG